MSQLGAAAALVLVARVFHLEGWSRSHNLLTFGVIAGIAYLVAAAWSAWHEYRGRAASPERIAGTILIGFLPLVVFAWRHPDIPGRLVAAELLVSAALIVLTALWRERSGWFKVALALVGVCSVGFGLMWKPSATSLPSVRTWRLNSALYPLRVTEYRTLIPPSRTSGGGVTAFRDSFILATGDGKLFLLRPSPVANRLASIPLAPAVPINVESFVAKFGDEEDSVNFRTADVLAQDLGPRVRLFATHHYWNPGAKCYVARISMLEADSGRLLRGELSGSSWRTIFESQPCIALGEGNHFGGIQIGGRLALLSDHELLLALGDHEHDGVNSEDAFSQDSGSSYGKTILLDLRDFSARLYSIGHRNPQGLFADGADAIWLTEHGPQGGDELNLVHLGANYGWPRVTFGTQYGSHFWPGATVPGSHDGSGFEQPFYSWVPSIGVSSLLVVHSEQFKWWSGDLLISSLRDQALYRARVRDSRVVMLERMFVGRRIRDITEGASGQLLLLTDSGKVLQVEPDRDVGGGEAVFATCSGCHAIGDGTTHRLGPDLRRVVDRPVASAEGFRYSSSLTNLGGRWTRERLDAFLTDPKRFAPGTRMRFPGLPDAEQRRELIEFLGSATGNTPPPEDQTPD